MCYLFGLLWSSVPFFGWRVGERRCLFEKKTNNAVPFAMLPIITAVDRYIPNDVIIHCGRRSVRSDGSRHEIPTKKKEKMKTSF
jgi:hypothetical protein